MDTTIKVVCENCGNTFETKPSNLAHGRGKCCSLKCSYESRGRNSRKRVTRICQRCGKEFEITPSMDKKGKGVYCSWECLHPPVINKCAKCGKEFRSSPSSKATYCSKSCAYKSEERSDKIRKLISGSWNDPSSRIIRMEGIRNRSNSDEWKSAKHFQRGVNHPTYKGNKKDRAIAVGRYEYKQWHKHVLERSNFTCQKCGKRGGFLQAHHIEDWANNPKLRYDVSNGIALCEDCHLIIHGSTRKPITKTCRQCGNEFRPNKSRQVFCNRECFYAFIRATRVLAIRLESSFKDIQ